jgi:transcriptional regulator with XRE-family HTH domain
MMTSRRGDAIRRVRHRAGLSHAELAAQIGFTPARVRLLETNDHFATHMVLLGVALAAGVNVNELLDAPVSCPRSVRVRRLHGASDSAVPHERSSHPHHTGRPRHLRPRNRIADRKTSE